MKTYLLLITALLAGCELFTDFRTITVTLPENSPPWFIEGFPEANVVYPGKSGNIENLTVSWKGSFILFVKKGSYIPVACYPSGMLKPAGGILPLDFDDRQQLQLNWESGFSADLLLGIMKKGISIENLDVKKLTEEINKKCNGDPWSIDRAILEDAILYNSMSVYKVKKSETMDIAIPASGLWISDNPFYPVTSSDTEGTLNLKGIYTGIHRFRNTEAKKYLDILVDTEGYQYLISQQY